jgi:hypothetical protein
MDVLAHLFEQREQAAIDDDDAILGVVDDVKAPRVETQVERVQDCTGGGNGEIRFEMPVMIVSVAIRSPRSTRAIAARRSCLTRRLMSP